MGDYTFSISADELVLARIRNRDGAVVELKLEDIETACRHDGGILYESVDSKDRALLKNLALSLLELRRAESTVSVSFAMPAEVDCRPAQEKPRQ